MGGLLNERAAPARHASARVDARTGPREMVRPLADAGVGTQSSFLRKSFELASPGGAETLRISALGLYRAFINGQRVGDDVLTPGWTCYDERLVLPDLRGRRPCCRHGENVIDIWLGDGWYRSQMMWATQPDPQHLGRARSAPSPNCGAGARRCSLETDASWSSGAAAGPEVRHLFRRDLRRPAGRRSTPTRARGRRLRHRRCLSRTRPTAVRELGRFAPVV